VTKSIGDLLRMAKMISVKLGQGDVYDWFDHELHGYPIDTVALPDYRLIGGGQLEFSNPYIGWCPTSIPPLVDIPIHEAITKLDVYRPGDRFYLSPAEKFPLTDLQGKSEPIMSFQQRVEFSVSAVIALVEGVKSRLVDWSIELEKQGILGEKMSFKDEEKALAKNVTINVGTMTGGLIGDASHSSVEVHSYGSVLSLLESSAVPKDEKDQLKQILAELQQAAAREETRPARKIDLVVKQKWAVCWGDAWRSAEVDTAAAVASDR